MIEAYIKLLPGMACFLVASFSLHCSEDCTASAAAFPWRMFAQLPLFATTRGTDREFAASTKISADFIKISGFHWKPLTKPLRRNWAVSSNKDSLPPCPSSMTTDLRYALVGATGSSLLKLILWAPRQTKVQSNWTLLWTMAQAIGFQTAQGWTARSQASDSSQYSTTLKLAGNASKRSGWVTLPKLDSEGRGRH